MIPLPCRQKGAALLGARHPGEQGPFGEYGAEGDGQDDEKGPLQMRTPGGDQQLDA